VTRAYAEVIGDPIAQSKSPTIHNYWLGQLGIDAEYRACHVRGSELADYFAASREDPSWRGCNVTMPHKQAVMSFLDRHEIGAELIEAVNTVVPGRGGRLLGSNTDGAGFLEPLRPVLAERHLFRMARVLGTGGAARAIVAALAEAGFVVVLAGRDPAKASALLEAIDPGGEHHATDLAHFAEPTDFAFDDRAG
jgi:shikimate dehydrogenase